ncbi:head GIN domain-containing protein [Dehalogenimonas alkenigignens]|uniref:Putative auto-transporter adhesin head GIN domain-containing protein n=1 Tax=Dehalogenimonas alkenigignens TaxID=1217799 RepID=A0A0W0GGK9_9CHLR|nr:head GIN domain-containing protein [Dehalogenimonas alkenigignens]KTB47686.1 Protein of unknown function (DUF2807) [Dehalogenimonas alkenigignens]PVV84046.1 DUF2807 domain-containing protein [Dehalogenimonas alkenigignens]
MARKEYDFSGFTEVEARNALKVEIRRADTYSIAVEADEEVLNDIKLTVAAGRLTARLEARWGHLGLLFKGSPTPKVLIAMPSLQAVEFAAASRGEITGFAGGGLFKVELAGASKLSGDVACGTLEIMAGAASHVELTGKADSAAVELSGASNANLEKMSLGDAKVKLGGASTATLNLTGKLDADVTGASSLRWLGTPEMGNIKITGASSFSRK